MNCLLFFIHAPLLYTHLLHFHQSCSLIIDQFFITFLYEASRLGKNEFSRQNRNHFQFSVHSSNHSVCFHGQSFLLNLPLVPSKRSSVPKSSGQCPVFSSVCHSTSRQYSFCHLSSHTSGFSS